MREVIGKVVETETQASRLVEAARREAEAILSKARREAEDIAARVRQATQSEIQQMLTEEALAARTEKEAQLRDCAAELESRIRVRDSDKHEAVMTVVRSVCQPVP